jgi:iron(III) transport system permease protein
VSSKNSTFFETGAVPRFFKAIPTYGWTIAVLAIALLIAMPVLVVLSSVFTDSSDVLNRLVETVLWRYIVNSLWLMLGVGVGVLGLGVSTAWLVTMCQFPGGRWFEWALLLPLAAPAYVLAYAYTDLLDYYGVVQTMLRQWFGWSTINDYWFPDVRSLGGAIVMLSLVLYPYVYLLARVAFLEQAVCTTEASRSLGRGPWRSFFTVALPLARPAIATGLSLALMETLNDFGTVDFFGVQTFTTGIYRTWFNVGERLAAKQLATGLLIFVFSLIALERWSRRQARYYQTTGRNQSLTVYRLRGWRSLLSMMICAVPVLLGLVVPVAIFAQMTITNLDKTLNPKFWELSKNSLLLAVVTAAIAIVISVIMAYGVRLNPSFGMRFGVRVAALGYAVPGSVIAVGTLIPLARFDNWLDGWMRSLFDISTGLLFSGTMAALVFAYLVRFLAVSIGAVESSLQKIKPTLDDASRSLGQTPIKTLVRVHTPLMWSGLLTSIMLIFVDVMKELPATIVIRPFNFDTLAVRVYRYASDERLVEASAPALAILLVGLLPVILLSVQIARSRQRRT